MNSCSVGGSAFFFSASRTARGRREGEKRFISMRLRSEISSYNVFEVKSAVQGVRSVSPSSCASVLMLVSLVPILPSMLNGLGNFEIFIRFGIVRTIHVQ